MRRVFILRPEPGATATFDLAAAQGLNPIKLPLFAIERVDWKPPADLTLFDGLLLTSANAIREGGEGLDALKALPVFAVGPATAKAARAAGFEVAKVGPNNAGGLLRAIDPDLRLLHLAGEDRIDQRLAWQKLTVVPVYRAPAIEQVDVGPLHGAVVLIHSPRAGVRLAEIVRDRSGVAVAAISEAAARACGDGWRDIAFVPKPDDRALLALAARLCEKPGE